MFLGSSSIKRWNVHEAFSGLPVINHGFGGSQYADALYFVDRLVVDYKPKTVVVYEGDNDLNSGKSPEQVASDGIATVMAIRRGLP